MIRRFWLPVLLLVVLCCAAFSAEEPEALAVFECREYLNRDWGRTMVTYAVELPGRRARPGRVRLIDEEGAEVPCQLWGVERARGADVASARVSFMAELPAKGAWRYRLLSGRPKQAKSAIRVSKRGGLLTLDNGLTAVRLPKAGRRKFRKPLRFGADHGEMVQLFGRQERGGIAPGPIQGIRLSDGRWVGGSYFYAADPQAAPALQSYTCDVVEGPVFVEARVRYAFTEGRDYEVRVRLLPGDPAVRIDEQFDMRRIVPTEQFGADPPGNWEMVVSLSSGWREDAWLPDHVYWGRFVPGNSMREEHPPLETRLTELGFDFKPRTFGLHSIAYDQPRKRLFGVEAWEPYADLAAHVGLVSAGTVTEKDATPFLGIVPMHPGNWRGDGPRHRKYLCAHDAPPGGGDLAFHWPLDVEEHPNSITHTGEFDPEMPYTFCRRQWALLGGPMQTVQKMAAFRRNEGYVNLDDYKDWMLDWPIDPRIEYPRLFFSKADVARLAATLDEHPAADTLKGFLYFRHNGKRLESLWRAKTDARNLWASPLGQINNGLGTWRPVWRQAHMAAGWVGDVEELFSSPHLSEERRLTMRRYVAALCSLHAEPDFNPRGSMAHNATPNMSIIRTLALPLAAMLIPDHPRAQEWIDTGADYVRYKMAMNTAPGGGWSELFTYYDASAPSLIHTVNLLARSGRAGDELVRLAKEVGMFPLRFLTPVDPRFGVRLVPAWGHEGRCAYGQWLPLAALMRERDPKPALSAIWGWDQIGRQTGYHDIAFNSRCAVHADLLKGLPADQVPEEMASAWAPGVGAVLRAHAGDPEETYLSYRQGYMISHSDDNQCDFVLHAKGAPLVVMSLFAYGLHQHRPYVKLNSEFGWYSQVRFGSQTNGTDVRKGSNVWPQAGSWNPSSAVHAHAFSTSVDYLRGHTDNEGRRWTRQIMFLKGDTAGGPNYFVFRDSADPLSGKPEDLAAKWWNLRTLGKKGQVALGGDGMDHASEFGPRLAVRFLQPAAVAGESRDASRQGNTPSHASGWRKGGKPAIVNTRTTWKRQEETITVTSFGPIEPAQDVLVVLYPQGEGEDVPKCELLADGAARMTTGEGVDYVFTDRKPMAFDGGDVAFRGMAGAVRVRKDAVHLVISEGPGELRYKGLTLRSAAPAARTFPVAEAQKARVIEVPAPKSSITLDAPTDGWEPVQPGVRVRRLPDFACYEFDAEEEVRFKQGSVEFVGRKGCVVNEMRAGGRVVMIEGKSAAVGGMRCWGCDGPYDVTFHHDRIVGRSGGLGRLLSLTKPAGVDRVTSLVIDGTPYMPGTRDDTLVVPLLPGEHRFEVHNLAQPPVYRNWQAW